MTGQALPKKLKREPLVDAIFEIRFTPSTAASTVLPGFFFAKLQPKKWEVELLPAAEIPSQIRSVDNHLRYQPLMRIRWDNFIILIGDTTLGLACNIPYPGWANFKERIVRAVGILVESNIVKTVERYSLKYVDVLEAASLAEQIQRVNLDLRVGSHTVAKEAFTVRVEIPDDAFIKVVQIAASATAKTSDGRVRKGSLVDIDTICNYKTTDLKAFADELPDRLEAIHIENKKVFFDCLRPETIKYLEPVYD